MRVWVKVISPVLLSLHDEAIISLLNMFLSIVCCLRSHLLKTKINKNFGGTTINIAATIILGWVGLKYDVLLVALAKS